MDNSTGSAKNLVRALALLRVLSERVGGLGLAEISRLGGLPKPTAHRLLSVLAEAGMVRENGRGEYGLGPQCLVLGGSFLEGLSLREEAREVMEELVERSGETCHLGIRDGDHVVYVEKIESPQVVQLRSRVGLIAPLHTTALGKALLAYGDEAEVEALFAAGVEKRTANTITELEDFLEVLERVRRRRFAVDDAENEESIRCVAASVFDHEGRVAASISLSGPEFGSRRRDWRSLELRRERPRWRCRGGSDTATKYSGAKRREVRRISFRGCSRRMAADRASHTGEEWIGKTKRSAETNSLDNPPERRRMSVFRRAFLDRR